MAREIRPDVAAEWPAPAELDRKPAEDHRPPLDDPADRRWLDRDDPRRYWVQGEGLTPGHMVPALEADADSEGGETE